MQTGHVKILSIEAWAESEGGWTWNNWHQVGTMPLELFESPEMQSDAARVAWMVEQGYLTQVEGCQVEDDQYNIVFCDESTGEPLFAMEYGPLY